MTFLSNLLCCFDVQDNERREHSLTSHHPKLTKTQSNIHKALSQRPSQQALRPSSSDLNTTSKPSTSHIPNNTSSNNKNQPQQLKHRSSKYNNNSNNTTNNDNNTMNITNNNPEDQITKNQVHEYTRTKDSTDSSKDEETVSDQNQSNNYNDEEVITNTIVATVDEDAEMADEEEEIYQEDDMEDQYDELDLTRIQTGQAVAESGSLLNPQPEHLKGRKCLVLDLDETLVHSSFKYVRHSDFVIPVEIENQLHNVYVIKRPGVDEFLKKCGEIYEVVVFTASVSRYGDPLLDILDSNKSIHHRLFRESCYNYQGNYIKNLSQMGRPLEDLIIIDNSPASYIFHPQHSVPVSSWFSDTHDCELPDLLPFLEDLASKDVDDVGLVLDVNL